MMFSKAQQEIVDLALQGKRLKEVVMLLDKSEDEILLDTLAEWYTVLQAGNEEIREILPVLSVAFGVLKELSQDAERESVSEARVIKGPQGSLGGFIEALPCLHLDGHTRRPTPPSGVTSSTNSLTARWPLKCPSRATARVSVPCAFASQMPSNGSQTAFGLVPPPWSRMPV